MLMSSPRTQYQFTELQDQARWMDACNAFALVGHNNIDPENKLKRIKRIIQHEMAFQDGYYKNNIGSEEALCLDLIQTSLFIAVLELLLPVDFHSQIKPICMPQITDRDYFYHSAHIASFGFTGEPAEGGGNGWPSTLRGIQATIWPKFFCKVVVERNFWGRPRDDLLGDIFAYDTIHHDNLG